MTTARTVSRSELIAIACVPLAVTLAALVTLAVAALGWQLCLVLTFAAGGLYAVARAACSLARLAGEYPMPALRCVSLGFSMLGLTNLALWFVELACFAGFARGWFVLLGLACPAIAAALFFCSLRRGAVRDWLATKGETTVVHHVAALARILLWRLNLAFSECLYHTVRGIVVTHQALARSGAYLWLAALAAAAALAWVVLFHLPALLIFAGSALALLLAARLCEALYAARRGLYSALTGPAARGVCGWLLAFAVTAAACCLTALAASALYASPRLLLAVCLAGSLAGLVALACLHAGRVGSAAARLSAALPAALYADPFARRPEPARPAAAVPTIEPAATPFDYPALSVDAAPAVGPIGVPEPLFVAEALPAAPAAESAGPAAGLDRLVMSLPEEEFGLLTDLVERRMLCSVPAEVICGPGRATLRSFARDAQDGYRWMLGVTARGAA